MKIRTDFVTNSSSSSFVAVTIKNPTLLEIFKKYQGVISEKVDHLKIGSAEIKIGCIDNYVIPEGSAEILDTLLTELLGIIEDDNEPLFSEIKENSDQIMKDMKFIKFVSGDVTYGEDYEGEDEFDPEYEFDVYTYANGKEENSSITDDGSYYDEFVM